MKKTIILVAVAIAALSCSKTYETKNAPVDGTPISLSSWSNTLTKARTAGDDAFASGDKFYVYAYTSGTATPFEGETVSFDGTDWTYSPVRFWNRNYDYYSFYAVSPSEDVAEADLVNSVTYATGVIVSKSITFAGNDNDILVADSVKVMKSAYGQEVQLNFRHAAALFDLKVRKGDGLKALDAAGQGAIVKVQSVALENINATGTFTVASYDASSAVPTINWASTATASYDNTKGVVPVSFDSSNPLTVINFLSDSDTQFLINKLIVMPQTFAANAQRLKISYTITTGSGATEQVETFADKTYDLVLFDKTDYDTDDDTGTGVDYNAGTNVSGWVGGVHYTYIITIDAEAITFDATLTPWTTDDGYYYILN